MPIDAVRSFAAAAGLASRRLVVLGSTSAYDVHAARTYPPPWIDESAPIDLTKPRVQGEELLRRHCAAIVLRVAGIYGPGRNPLDWIRSGRVGPSPKYVNFIHVEDLALSCLAALDRGRPGDVYNVGDGTPRTWEDLCQVARRDWGIAPHASPLPDVGGKRISAEKLRKELGVKMLHGDLYRELKGLQQPPAGKTRTDT
jgi:nucleoside-diphosphate-sugar epimerase